MFHWIPKPNRKEQRRKLYFIRIPKYSNIIRIGKMIFQLILKMLPLYLQIFDSDGFFHTGDLGYYDNQGAVYFIECIANLINFW